MAAAVDTRRVKHYRHLRFELGLPRVDAARQAKVSLSWAKKFDHGFQDNGRGWAEARLEERLPGPKRREELGPDALRALDDFEFFRLRYFGHVSTPWQVEAAYRTVELLESPHREFVVVNCPPGSGKTTLFTHDLPAWLTCRDRSIRGLLGSRGSRLATLFCAELRRSFERVTPVLAKEDELRRGLAVDAVATLAADFGRFKPDRTDVWAQEQFIVAQVGDTLVSDKEPTWAAFGMDSTSLGWRVNYIGWDDLVDKSTIRTLEAVDNQREWFDDEAETRLEPGGLLNLVGQRRAPRDLYRYCLDKTVGEDADDDPDDDEGGLFSDDELAALPVRDGLRRKYHHIVFRAHYEDRCGGRETHRRGSAPYPEGCLLDPARLPWRDLRMVQTQGSQYATVYQQDDVDVGDVLVRQVWVDGGVDPDTGELCPGVWDKWREPATVPPGLAPPVLSFATVDPGQTKWWCLQWWLYVPASETRLLVDMVRRKMGADELLDWNVELGTWTGVMQDWQLRSVALGAKIGSWVVERNAAQRYLLQYDHVRRWRSKHLTLIHPHDTYSNRADPVFGIEQTVGPTWRFGRVRLPGTKQGRALCSPLVREATTWPGSVTEDCVMAEWFGEFWLPRLRSAAGGPADPQWRPTWLAPSPERVSA